MRRFRASLKFFEYFTGNSAKKNFKQSLKKLTKSLGDLRNIDEAFLFFQLRVEFSDSNQLYQKLTKIRAIELSKIKKLLNRFDHKFDKQIETMTAKLNKTSFSEDDWAVILNYFRNDSDNFSKTIHKLLRSSTIIKNPNLRHKLRITIKKWRYFLEIAVVVLNHNYENILKILKNYQSVLGKLNDVKAFGSLCSDMNLVPKENKLIKSCLLMEEQILLNEFAKLIKQKSLLKMKVKM